MLQAMVKLATKSDVLRIVITIVAFLAVWGIIEAFVNAAKARTAIPLVFGIVSLLVVVATVVKLFGRAKKLMAGRCPNSMCHGTVHHSELVRRGQLVCPTCKSKWPEVKGMKFRATGREDA
jgi:hypothetical protein